MTLRVSSCTPAGHATSSNTAFRRALPRAPAGPPSGQGVQRSGGRLPPGPSPRGSGADGLARPAFGRLLDLQIQLLLSRFPRKDWRLT